MTSSPPVSAICVAEACRHCICEALCRRAPRARPADDRLPGILWLLGARFARLVRASTSVSMAIVELLRASYFVLVHTLCAPRFLRLLSFIRLLYHVHREGIELTSNQASRLPALEKVHLKPVEVNTTRRGATLHRPSSRLTHLVSCDRGWRYNRTVTKDTGRTTIMHLLRES